MFSRHRTFVIILLTGAILGALVMIVGSGKNPEQLKGLKFTSISDLQKNPFEKPSKKPLTKAVAPKVALLKALNSKEQQLLDTLKIKQVYLENFPLEKDHTALEGFFNSLSTCSDSAVHVWYYGDSQIEGDRVTGELRDLLQARFGGGGTGYVPFADLATFRYYELQSGSNLVKLNCFNNRGNKGFGFAGKVYKFNSGDSAILSETGIKVSKALRYNKLWLVYGNHPGGVLKWYSKDSSAISMKIPASKMSNRLLISGKAPSGNLKFKLPSKGDYFGWMFESNKGIQIDNCGIRGHSGDGLKYIPGNLLAQDAATWNTKLVVFSFGNNMIPYIKSGEKNMKYYTRVFEEIFSKYRKALPGVSMLVVSAGDMGTVVQDEEIPYSNVEEFVEAMRVAAINTGCAFFDAHAMIAADGGILGWKRKGLAGLDGHLTPSGQKKYAGELYKALMNEYEIFKLTHTAP